MCSIDLPCATQSSRIMNDNLSGKHSMSDDVSKRSGSILLVAIDIIVKLHGLFARNDALGESGSFLFLGKVVR